MTHSPNPILGHSAQLLSSFAWATGLIVQKFLVEDANTASILLCQFVFAAALMWVGLTLLGSLPPISSQSAIRIAWGLLAPGAALIFSLAGAARTDGVSVSLIYGLIPLISPVLALLLIKEPLHWSFPLGAIISLVGIFTLTFERIEDGEATLTGNLLVFCGVLCACFSHVLGRRLNTGGFPWHQSATLQVTGAAIATLALALWTGLDFPDFSQPTNLALIGYLVLIMTIANYLAFNLALANIRAAWVSLYSALIPVIGALTAVVLLNDRLSALEFIGLLIITAGIALPHSIRARGRLKPNH